jgi:hypothetical protein
MKGSSAPSNKVLQRLNDVLKGNSELGRARQIEAVIHAKIVPALVHLGVNESPREAAVALSDLTFEASPSQIHYLVLCGCVSSICNLLHDHATKNVISNLFHLRGFFRFGFLFCFRLCCC